MKKGLFASLLIVPSLLIGNNVYAEEDLTNEDVIVQPINLTSDQVKQMEGLGFTKEEIDEMDEEEFEENKEYTGTVISQEEKYYKVETDYSNTINQITPVSEKEALSEISKENNTIMAHSAVTKSSSLLKMHTSASKLSNGNIKLKNSFRWLKQPQVAFKDVVGISHSASAVKVPGTANFSYAYTDGTGKHKVDAIGTKTSSTGVAKKFDLKKVGATIAPYDHHGYVSVQLKKGNKNDIRANGYGHYVHTEVGLSASVSIKTGELSVGPNIKQSKMDDTMVMFNY